MPDVLQLLREAVAAKARYWDAERALELALRPDFPQGELSNAAVEHISVLAGGIDDPAQAYTKVTAAHADNFVKERADLGLCEPRLPIQRPLAESGAEQVGAGAFAPGTPDNDLTPAQLEAKYNPSGGGEHPIYPRQQWRDEVAAEETILGYWEWVAYGLDLIAQMAVGESANG